MSEDTVPEQHEDAVDGGDAPEGSALGSTVAGEPPLSDEPDAAAALRQSNPEDRGEGS
ncbi:MAG: hypothetical protein QOH12_3674 [Solirubrobacteraceae bacterium]|jgi:hypothetical protein|nr:hypothetical protein [Solirubrobacteraceae bacterium]